MSARRWTRISRDLVLPIISDAGIAGPVADGRLVPALIVDTGARPEVAEMIRVHEHLPPGDVASQWASVAESDDLVALVLKFERPVALEVTLLFSIERQALVIDSVLNAGALYLQAGQAGDRLSTRLDAPRILIEIPDMGFGPHWDILLRKRMTNVMATRLGVSRRKARPAAEKFIREMRRLRGLRFSPRRGND